MLKECRNDFPIFFTDSSYVKPRRHNACVCKNNVTAKILCHKEDNEGKKEFEECNSHHPTRGRFPSALTWGYCRQYLHRGRPARAPSA